MLLFFLLTLTPGRLHTKYTVHPHSKPQLVGVQWGHISLQVTAIIQDLMIA